MTKWWRKYWKEKNHIRKSVCDDLLGIDSFRIFENPKTFATKREDYFAFNNYDSNCERKLNVVIDGNKFCFYLLELGRKLHGNLSSTGLHISFIDFFLNSSVGYPTVTNRVSYLITIERQQCNGCTFFHCPAMNCNRRMRKLYYSCGFFLCRKCLGLGYRSQRVSPFQRKNLV
jgi:hypothetical protein